ncbi:unnamed protein product [Prunus armeniaca]
MTLATVGYMAPHSLLLPDGIIDEVVDANLLGIGTEQENDDHVRKRDCISTIMRLVIICCAKSPEERISVEETVATLNKIKTKFLKDSGVGRDGTSHKNEIQSILLGMISVSEQDLFCCVVAATTTASCQLLHCFSPCQEARNGLLRQPIFVECKQPRWDWALLGEAQISQ